MKKTKRFLAVILAAALMIMLPPMPASAAADDGGTVPVLQATVAPGAVPGSVKVTVTDAVYGSENYALAVDITELSVNIPAPGDPAPETGSYLIDDYQSGSDITAGVSADKYLQVYALYEEGGQRLVAAFCQKQLAGGDIGQPATEEGEKDGGLITAFAALAEDIRWQNTASPDLPETVSGTVDGKAADIPVTWEADHDYDAGFPATGLYIFTAQLGESYTIAQGVEATRITVYIPAARMMARMAGGGTDTSPLEITTAAQLAEIAVLVNAGRLETFLFNDSSATVYLELNKDIDLSGYGRNWNGGKGWMGIGTLDNPFKGSFHGGYYTIMGLYLNDGLDYSGLFGCIDGGTVKFLNLVSSEITGRDCVGGVAGSVKNGGSVEYSYFSGSVAGDSNVGGIAGEVIDNATLESCYAEGMVSGAGSGAGGVAGKISGKARNCYSTAEVSGYNNAGGLVGDMSTPATVEYGYATGAVSGTNFVGGIVGSGDGGSVQSCAALNLGVAGIVYAGRVVGYEEGSVLSNNAAFAGMFVTECGSTKTIASNAAGVDGADITATEIKGDGTIGGRFTTANGWTVGAGWLPGRFVIVQGLLPFHITNGSDPYFPGEGTASNPFLIGTAAQLAKLAELINSTDPAIQNTYNGTYGDRKSYQLIADIDLSGYGASNTGFNDGRGWIPIGTATAPFEGYFGGDSKTITGLYINDSTLDNAGLFGYAQAGISDLQMTAVQITAKNSVGAVAGRITSDPAHTYARLERCSASGTVVGNALVGGIAGTIGAGGGASLTIKDCSSSCQVTGLDGVGGVVGLIQSGGVADSCYATGAVTATADNVCGGGIAGEVSYNGDKGRVQNCIALGPSVTGANNIGRFSRVAGDMGSLYGGIYSDNMAFDGMTITADGTTKTITSDAAGSDGASKTADELQGQGGFPSAFISDPWTYTPGYLPGLFGRPAEMPAHITAGLTSANYFAGGDGSEDDPYIIATAAQLAKLAELTNAGDTDYNDKYYDLTENIDLSGYASGEGWTPIGTSPSLPFKGSFNGSGRKITGLFINRPGSYYQGLFGYMKGESDCRVINLGVENANITGNNFTGGIAGYTSSVFMEHCYVTGAVSGADYVGGVAGLIDTGGSIETSYADCSVSGMNKVGGIAGTVYGPITSSYASGTVSGSNSVGGVAGDVADASATLAYCYSTGSVSGNTYVGGVTGIVSDYTAKVRNCAALNSSVIGNAIVGRVAGSAIAGYGSANAAFAGIPGAWSNIGANNLDGASITANQINAASFWTSAANWKDYGWEHSSAWIIDDNTLPILTGTGGDQSGDTGLYLTERDLQYATVILSQTSFDYDSAAKMPFITVIFGDDTLAENTDYTVTVTSVNGTGTSAGTNAGTVTLKLTGKGNFTGEKTGVTFTISPKILTDDMLMVADGPFTYTGTAQAPALTVEDGGVPLALGTDYENVTYVNNINAGAAAGVSITGKGNYQGTVNKSFTIAKAPLTITGGTAAAKTYDNTTGAIINGVTFGGLQNGESFTLDTDYIVSGAMFDSANAGSGKTVTGTVTLNAAATANNYSLANGSLSISGQTIAKAAAPTGMNQTLKAVKGHAQDYPFDLTTLLPSVTGTLGTVTYAPVITTNSDGVLGTLSYSSGSTLTLPVQSVADTGKTATVTVTVSSGNYNDFTATITIEIVNAPVSITAISGVTAPVRGAVPVTSITETDQYNGTVAWNPAHNPFAASTVYTATITLAPKTGYTLTGVAANFFTVAGATSASNAAGSGVITVVFPATAAAPGNSSGSSGGGSGGGTSAPPAGGQNTGTSVTGNTATATTTITATADSSGRANAAVTQAQVSDAVARAAAEAQNQGAGTAAAVEIKVEAPANATNVETSIPKAAVGLIAESGIASLTVSSPVASLTFDADALSTIAGEAAGDITITTSRVEASDLSAEAQQAVGDRPVFNFSVTSGDRTISQFEGNVSVSVPYTPKPGEDINAIVIYYINSEGKPEMVPNCKYDPATGKIGFTTNHFSTYAVGYNKVSFKDVAADAWYNKAVGFIAARGITTGTGNGNYSPAKELTRGEFIVMLMKAYGIAPDANPKDNFADSGNTYYTGYLAAAKRLGISAGVGNNMYAPGKEITRQEMFTLLYNALKVIGQLPQGNSGKTLSSFSDAGQIASWAKDAIALLVQTETIGGNNGKLSPTSTTTRAEMAQVLYNLMSK